MPTARTAGRGVRSTVLAIVAVLGTALIVGLVHQAPLPSSSSDAPAPSPSASPPAPPLDAPPNEGTDTAAAGLDPDLLAALRRAEADSARDGVALKVNSGWRSPEHQERLLREAVARYGSAEEAARWVATPETSPHVSGNAVDVATAGAAWLSEHGAAYGLCQIYGNEPWHYELRAEAVHSGCPPTFPDPTHDPRMQR